MLTRLNRLHGLGLAVAVIVTALPGHPAASAASDPTRVVTVPLQQAIANLPVAREVRSGYVREKFEHWVDANSDCQDTRAEVLIAESRITVRGACTVRSGGWFSYYDRTIHSNADDVDVDHFVPLAEAWDSGARRWSPTTRRNFANDLGDRRTLIAVTDSVNSSKSDQDPGEWMPRYGRCRYVRQWVAIKIRWSLTVDAGEKTALAYSARGCANAQIRVRTAPIGTTTPDSGGGSGTPTSPPPPGGPSYPPISRYDCPKNAPIKGNQSSMIYHPPSSPWYNITTPEECFATEAAASAAGYRRAIYRATTGGPSMTLHAASTEARAA